MGRMKELLNDEPFDVYGAGYHMHALESAVRDLDKFTTEELETEAEAIKAVTEYLEIRLKKIKARQEFHEIRATVPF